MNVEFYVQDNWKVNRRLTLDLGLRFYHQTPQIDLNKTFVNFVPSLYQQVSHRPDLCYVVRERRGDALLGQQSRREGSAHRRDRRQRLHRRLCSE